MKIDWKKAIGLTAAVSMLVPLAACGGSSDGGDKNASGSTEAVTLSVWAPQEDQAKDTNWLGKVEENFAKAHPEYNITWKNDVVSEGDASKQVSTDPSAAADVYMFASDQLGVLMDAKAIGQLGTDAEKQVKEQNGDLEVNSVTGTDGKLYGAGKAGDDDLTLTVAGNDGQLTVTALFDNLGKGASGAAVQNMNIMLGLEESTSLL